LKVLEELTIKFTFCQ